MPGAVLNTMQNQVPLKWLPSAAAMQLLFGELVGVLEHVEYFSIY